MKTFAQAKQFLVQLWYVDCCMDMWTSQYQFIIFTNPSARAGYDTRSIF